MPNAEGGFDTNRVEMEDSAEKSIREFLFYPEVEGHDLPIRVTVVGGPEDSPERQKELFGQVVTQKSVARMKQITDSGAKVLWNMATGSTFRWGENLPEEMTRAGVDPRQVIPIIKEEAFDPEGRHFPSGHPYDFRGKRIKSFHRLFGLEPENASVNDAGAICGNIVAPDYEMSAEEAVVYMNQTREALSQSGQTVCLTTTGVGEDGHVGEVQINMMGLEAMLRQRDFFLQPAENYSQERGMFRWIRQENDFYAQGNIYTRKTAEGWASASRGSEAGEEMAGVQVMGMGWRAMCDTPGGAIFAFDSGKKALAARSALEGSFPGGSFQNADGGTVASLEGNLGEGNGIYSELCDFVDQLIQEGILPNDFRDQDQYRPRTGKDGEVIDPGLIDRILQAIYDAYEENKLSPSDPENEQKYFQPIWKIVNRYLGMRSPVALWIRELYRRNTPIEMVLTYAAAQELPLQG